MAERIPPDHPGRLPPDMIKNPVHRPEQLPADYPQFLAEIKARIAAARTRAALAVNSELTRLYWEIGHEILDREQREGWGSGVINRLASDLRREFPAITGFSRSNLHYMRSFAEAWPLEGGSEEIVQQPVGQLPWGQNIALVTRLDDRDARVWYAASAVENGWSRKVLEAQIATDLRGRQGGALTSFDHALRHWTRSWCATRSRTPTTSSSSACRGRRRSGTSSRLCSTTSNRS